MTIAASRPLLVLAMIKCVSELQQCNDTRMGRVHHDPTLRYCCALTLVVETLKNIAIVVVVFVFWSLCAGPTRVRRSR